MEIKSIVPIPGAWGVDEATGHRPPTVGGGGVVDASRNEADSREPSLEAVNQAVVRLQELLKPLAQELRFSVDKETHRITVKLIDSASNKVLQQFPSQEMLRIAANIETQLRGVLVDQKS